MATYIETNEMKFDELIGGTSVTPLIYIAKVTAAGAGTIKKGTLMSEGAKYRFFIPARLAYGERGAPGAIPPNAALKSFST